MPVDRLKKYLEEKGHAFTGETDTEVLAHLIGELYQGDLEKAVQAALREVKEETTLTGLKFILGERFIETGPYSHGKTARYYLASSHVGVVSLPVNPELGRAEHNEYRWVSAPEARELLSPRVLGVLGWAEALLRPEDFV